MISHFGLTEWGPITYMVLKFRDCAITHLVNKNRIPRQVPIFQTKIHVSSLLFSWVIKIFYLPENIFYWDIVTGANSSNDMLILCQNVEINSNKYFCTTLSCYCYFRNEIVDHMACKSHLWEEGSSCPVYLLFGAVYWSRWSRVCRRLTSLLFYIRIEYFTYLTWHTTVDNMHFETVLKLENISPKWPLH